MTVSTDGRHLHAVINMTPMIDVLLVLLIIFMAIAPAPQAGFDAAVPQSSQDRASSPPENPIVLEIASDGSYRINSASVVGSSLHDRINTLFEIRADRTLFVKAADGLDYSVVATAIDIAHTARIDRVALMLR